MANTRSSNIELLRIFCMLFIIAGHIIMTHEGEEFLSESYYISNLMRPFFMVAVNAFILISGYFGLKLNAKKLWEMNDMVTFYSVLGFVLMVVLGIHSIAPMQDFMYFLPVLTKKYWFITVYFVLCLISPFLNAFVENADEKLLRNTIITGIVLFVFVPTLGYLLNFEAITADAGYGIMNFILLYFIGRYLKFYDPFRTVKKSLLLTLYLGSSLLCGLFQIGYSTILGFSFTSFISYNTIFVFIGAIALFIYFTKLDIGSSKIINYIASFSLCVYIIHIHPLVFSYLFNELLHVERFQGVSYVLVTLFLPIPIYLVCIGLEFIRKSVTGIIYRKLKL